MATGCDKIIYFKYLAFLIGCGRRPSSARKPTKRIRRKGVIQWSNAPRQREWADFQAFELAWRMQ